MKLSLERFSVSETETEGRLTAGPHVFATIEQPWRDNQKGISCIPLGEYEYAVIDSGRLGTTLWINGPEQNVYWRPTDEPHQRSEILIHPANFASELRGCIAPGLKRTFGFSKKDRAVVPMITDTREAMSQLLALVVRSKEPKILTITQRQMLWTLQPSKV